MMVGTRRITISRYGFIPLEHLFVCFVQKKKEISCLVKVNLFSSNE